MAPYVEDDFVLTISDNDQSLPALDYEKASTAQGPPPKNLENPKKRKRNAGEPQVYNSAANNDSKTTKKRKKGKAVATDLMDEESLNDEETWTAHGEDDGAMDSEFEFQIGDGNGGIVEDFDGWGLNGTGTAPKALGDKKAVDIDELIARRRRVGAGQGIENRQDDIKIKENEEIGVSDGSIEEGNEPVLGEQEDDDTMAEDGFGMGVLDSGEEDDGHGGMKEAEDLSPASDNESVAEPVSHPNDVLKDGSPTEESDGPDERARREAFFAPEETGDPSQGASKSLDSFQGMSLSRPILRGLASVGFTEPTPIQNKTIPVALLGKDVVGGAVTGSGKTAAFIIPILERLLYRPRKVPTSRVAILMPTRELAVQCFNVAKKLASFTDVTFCQMVGGFSLREQEAVLRSRPDVIIATPGRFIDHMRNSASFTVDTLEILVLDEADRMLEDGFADELNEILTTIPKSRQTMLFSATMTDRVDKLIRVGLNRPVRLMVDAKKQTVVTLTQEFVRLRPGREDKRLAYLLYLCENVFTDKAIIFFRQKREAHRVRIIFGLCGLKVTELHGNMTQEQRIASIESFRASRTTHLLATDLASRGLDIRAVAAVLNYEPPQSHAIYLHRVGRTARAGLPGRACTIAAEPDRKIVRDIVRAAKAQGARVVSRVPDPVAVDSCAKRISQLESEVEAVLGMEREERAMGEAEREVRRGENLVGFAGEIAARPRRTWFESEKAKKVGKEKGARELNGASGDGDGGKAEGKGKLSGKGKKKLDLKRERGESRAWKKGKGSMIGGGVETAKKKTKDSRKGGKLTPAAGAAGRGGATGKRGGARGGGKGGGKRGGKR